MSKRNTDSRKKTYLYLLSFFLPVILLLLVYAIHNVYPFGNKSLLVLDLNSQYVSYFAAYQNALFGDGSLLYSFSKNLGGGMIGLFAYYLASPLNVIFLFFPKPNFSEAILLLTLIKTGLCGFTFAVYLRKTFNQQHFALILFSSFYALMAYSIVYQQNIMWLDGVLLLPLVMLGIDQLIQEGKHLLYTVTLAAVIITNYYIGYMICLFSVLYFLYKLLLSNSFDAHKLSFALKKFSHFAFASVLAGGMSAFLSIPTLLALGEGKGNVSFSALALEPNFPFFTLFYRFYIGTSLNYLTSPSLPYIYSGVLTLILAAAYFGNKGIPAKTRILSGLFITVLLLSFYVQALNLIWHVFNSPVGFPFRYSFLFSFLLITLAYEGFIRFDLRHFKPAAMITAAVVISLFVAQTTPLSPPLLYITLILVIIYCGLLTLQKKIPQKIIITAFIFLLFFEFGINSLLTLRSFSHIPRHAYRNYVSQMEDIIGSIKEHDQSFYRLESTFRRTHNDSFLLNTYGLTHFSSTYEEQVNTFMEQLGFRNNINWAYYNKGSTITADSLLAVKYVLSKFPLPAYEQINQAGEILTFQNPYALPLGFMTKSTLLDVTMDRENPFILQDKITDAMISGTHAASYQPVIVKEIIIENLQIERNTNDSVYTRVDPEQEASLTFILLAESNHPLYAFFPAQRHQKVNLFLNGEPYGSYFDTYNYGVLALGSHTAGTEVKLTMELTTNRISMENQFYSLDMDLFNQIYRDLSSSPLIIDSFSHTRISGTVTATSAKPLLYTSIPYNRGWSVQVNGQPAEKVLVLNTLLGVILPPGTHTIELRYRPPALLPASAISFIFCLTFLFSLFSGKPKFRPGMEDIPSIRYNGKVSDSLIRK
jgi:uncharacterized membrane protein YfhO